MSYDGAPQNEVWEGWDVARPPDPDTISEIQVQTSDSTAKFSRPTTIVVSSKSGTNQLHGAIFETNRNSGYGVARARQDLIQAGTTSAFTKPPYLNRNEWGESLGGPIYIPKIYDGHNRTFFFFSWEDTRVPEQLHTAALSYPTAAMRNGDFSGLQRQPGARLQFLRSLHHRPQDQPAAASEACNGVVNTTCPSRLSPTAKYLFGVTPLPTLPQGQSADRHQLDRHVALALHEPGSENDTHLTPYLGSGFDLWPVQLRHPSRNVRRQQPGNDGRNIRRHSALVAGQEPGSHRNSYLFADPDQRNPGLRHA